MPKPLLCSPELFQRDLTGKVYVVTGGSSGIGRTTATQLAAQGAEVVLAVRDVVAGAKEAEQIRVAHPKARVEVEALNLASLRSVDAFADRFLTSHSRLDGLVNNAGVMNTPFGKTEDGFELQFGTNHLGHFHLTSRLLDLLTSTPGARVVNLASCYHDVAMGRKGTIDFDDLNFERRKYDGWQAYAQSKLANVLHAKELARRLEGTGTLAVSVHPGWVRTRLIRNTMPTFLQNLIGFKHLMQSAGMIEPWEGAQASLHALLSPDVVEHNGAYFSQTGHYRDKACNAGGFPLVSPNPHANDPELARRLWVTSEQLIERALSRISAAA